MRKVYVIGIGMGNPDTITVEGLKYIKASDAVVGAERMVKSFATESQETAYLIKPGDIWDFIRENENLSAISVLMSGDIGFFSGATKLRELFEENLGSINGNEKISIKYVSGLSSFQYFASQIGMEWSDITPVSLHGRSEDPVAHMLKNRKVFFLTDGGEHKVNKICRKITSHGLGNTFVYVGERLSYDDQKISYGTASELSEREFDPLSVMILVNEEDGLRSNLLDQEKITLGIPDENFIRGAAPMTKEEVRTVSVSKLDIQKGDIIYDIGAGTGSVSIEMSLANLDGKVYAIEVDKDSLELIHINKKKFNAENLEIISGMAPEAMEGLPRPDRAFIGGSKGNLKDIVKALRELNKDIRLVINVVSLESLVEAVELLKEFNFKYSEVVQISTSRAKKLGRYNLMMGQNPVFIITAEGI